MIVPALGAHGPAGPWGPPVVVGSWNSGRAVPLGALAHDAPPVPLVPLLLDAAARAAAPANGREPVVLWPFLDTAAAHRLAAADPERSLLLRCPSTAWLNTEVDDFEGYLDRLGSHRRNVVRKELRRFEESGARAVVRPLREVSGRLTDLLVQNKRRHGGRSDPDAIAALLDAQVEVFGDRALALCAVRAGTLHAVATAIEHQGALYGRAFGRSTDQQPIPNEYFVLGYYLAVRHCAEQGLREYHAGAQAYQVKALRGCEIEPLWTLLRTPGPLPPAFRATADRWNTPLEPPTTPPAR